MSRLPPVASVVLAIEGLALLAWLGWSTLYRSGVEAKTPYRYELVTEDKGKSLSDLRRLLPDLTVRKYELRSTDLDQPLATLHVGTRRGGDAGPVLLDWHNQLAEPLVTIAPPLGESSALAKAVKKHLPQGAMVLGWWDTSRRLALLSGVDTLFHEHLGRPLLLPAVWNDRRAAVARTEQRFWHAPEGGTDARFERFQAALLADPVKGAKALRKLAGSRDAYLVLHVSDAYKLGMLNPQRFGIGYRDFPNSGNLHSVIGFVKKWLTEKGYTSYTVEKRGGSSVRVYFLTDARSRETLIARALPFTTSRPLQLKTLEVVFQHGGYWVYKVPARAKETDS